MPGLWRNADGEPEGKYLVVRRDGSTVDWPYFVMSARDPAAPAALMRYAEAAAEAGLDDQYCADIRRLADRFNAYRLQHGPGDPDAPPDRQDNPAITAQIAAVPKPSAPSLSQKRLRPLPPWQPASENEAAVSSISPEDAARAVGVCEECFSSGNKAADGSVAQFWQTSFPGSPIFCNGVTRNQENARVYANHKKPLTPPSRRQEDVEP